MTMVVAALLDVSLLETKYPASAFGTSSLMAGLQPASVITHLR